MMMMTHKLRHFYDGKIKSALCKSFENYCSDYFTNPSDLGRFFDSMQITTFGERARSTERETRTRRVDESERERESE